MERNAADFISHHDSNQMDWKEFRPGSNWKFLQQDKASGQMTFLVRWDAGYRMGAMEHNRCEKHLYILEGTFVDQFRTSTAGTYIHLLPGSEHLAHTPDGCLFLEVCQGGAAS